MVRHRWRSFLRGGSVAFYIFLYSLGFMVNTLHLMSGLSIEATQVASPLNALCSNLLPCCAVRLLNDQG